jgi:hypothetical protein
MAKTFNVLGGTPGVNLMHFGLSMAKSGDRRDDNKILRECGISPVVTVSHKTVGIFG